MSNGVPPRRCALVAVDLQIDFIAGPLLVPGAAGLLPIVNAAVASASAAGWPVIFTRDWHPQDHASFEPQGGPWPIHCIADSSGAALHPELAIPSDAIIVSKGTSVEGMGYSPFEDGEFVATLRILSVKRLVVVGVALEYCVKSTCVDARTCGLDVIAVKDLIASVSQDTETIQQNWQELESCGVTVVANFNGIPWQMLVGNR